MKVKRKDIRFYERDQTKHGKQGKMLCALVQIHKSNKTGRREVNAMGGEFAMRVFNKSQHRRKEDFLFCHLDGTPFTTKQFREQFRRMIAFTKEEERTGKHLVPYSLRHLYATIRLQHGTSYAASDLEPLLVAHGVGGLLEELRGRPAHEARRRDGPDLAPGVG